MNPMTKSIVLVIALFSLGVYLARQWFEINKITIKNFRAYGWKMFTKMKKEESRTILTSSLRSVIAIVIFMLIALITFLA